MKRLKSDCNSESSVMFRLSNLSLEVPRFDLYRWGFPLWLFVHCHWRLDFMTSNGISCGSLALWSCERKCSQTSVGLELLVCLSTGLRCSLKRSLSRQLCCEVKQIFFLEFLNAGHTWTIAAKSACLLHVVNLVTLTVLIVKSTQVVTFANNVNTV